MTSLSASNSKDAIREVNRLEQDCLICGENAWWLLPVPIIGRSMLSDGGIVCESLEKCTCSVCGLVRHTDFDVERQAKELFGSEYSLSSHEPSIGFEGVRQKHYANWILDVLKDKDPGTVLELGCGNGSLIKELMPMFPTAKFMGLEPSEQGVRQAKHAGLPVQSAYISGEDSVKGIHADIVVSVNVVEHTLNPVEFLRAARAAVNPGGLVITICPDASVVGTELLFFDHFFSFCPSNLKDLVLHSGLEPIAHHCSPSVLPGFQMVVAQSQLSERTVIQSGIELKKTDTQALQTERERYMAFWKELDVRLSNALSRYCSVAIFGAGEMANLIQAYAPQSWEKVKHVVVDNPLETEFAGRPVLPYSEWSATDEQILLVAVSPNSSKKVVDRLKLDGHVTLSLDSLV